MLRLPAAIVALVLLLVLPVASAGAATVTKREQWQVFTSVGPRLQDDGANLFRITPAVDRFQLGSVRWVVTWANFSSVAITQNTALRVASEPGNAALLDRPLSAAEALRFSQRVLWREADVLAVHPSNPVCANGITRAQAVGVLDGTVTSWPQLVAEGTWPASIEPEFHGYRPITRRSGYVEPFFGVTRYGAERYPSAESSARTQVAADPQAVAPMRYSAVRGRPEVCAVPIDGVRPEDATVRAATYPASYAVRWVTAKRQDGRSRMALARFSVHLFGARGAAYLRTEAGRNRLR